MDTQDLTQPLCSTPLGRILLWISFALSTSFGAAGNRRVQPEKYFVPGRLIILKQRKATCWATTAAMMINRKEQKSFSVNSVVSAAGPQFEAIYKAGESLPAPLKSDFLKALGIEAEGPQEYTDEGWFELRRRYGLLWVTTATPFSDEPFSTHARLIRGVAETGTAGHLVFRVVDPENGTEYDEDSVEFFHDFEALTINELHLTSHDKNLMPQVFHFPEIERR